MMLKNKFSVFSLCVIYCMVMLTPETQAEEYRSYSCTDHALLSDIGFSLYRGADLYTYRISEEVTVVDIANNKVKVTEKDNYAIINYSDCSQYGKVVYDRVINVIGPEEIVFSIANRFDFIKWINCKLMRNC